MERNQRFALALEIKNPDLSGKLGNPAYSDFLKTQAKQNPNLIASVEKTLFDIVMATREV
jgi:transcriptional repressor NF-X1